MTTLRGRRVLLTGAGGSIGSHLVERLLVEHFDTGRDLAFAPDAVEGFIRAAAARDGLAKTADRLCESIRHYDADRCHV